MNESVDTEYFIQQIDNSPKRGAIVAMFVKGPEVENGFMWSNNMNGYWTEEEYEALREVGMMVIDRGWESSGYGLMMRKLQHHFVEQIR